MSGVETLFSHEESIKMSSVFNLIGSTIASDIRHTSGYDSTLYFPQHLWWRMKVVSTVALQQYAVDVS